MADYTIFPATVLIGGGDGALDAFSVVDIDACTGGARAFVITTTYSYQYTYDPDSELAESSPDVIAPDDVGADPGRWILVREYISADADTLEGYAADDFAYATHGSDHVSATDPIPDAATDTKGIMTTETFDRVWSPPNFRNLIINGNMWMWQRGTAATSAAGYVSADRWVINASSNIPVLRRESITLGAITTRTRYSLRFNTTADAGVGDYQIISQRIEDVRTCQAKRVTVSFWTYCTTDKDIAVTLRQYFGTGGSPSAIVEVAPIVAESPKCAVSAAWTQHVLHFDLPSITGKTIGTNEDSYVQLLFWVSTGSDWNTITDTLGHQTMQGYITNVQLEEGDITTPVFEERPHALEEMLCYRYYWRCSQWFNAFASYADNSRASWRVLPPVRMRAVPSCTSSFTNATLTACDTLTFSATQSNEENGGYLYVLSTGAAVNCNFTFGTGDYIALSAEL